jgi:hypothetical protein
MLGCSFEAVEPRRSPLVPERTHEQLPRIAEGADERIHPDRLVADRHPHLAKIDMQLFARRRLKPHACPGLSTQRLAQWRHRALDGAATPQCYPPEPAGLRGGDREASAGSGVSKTG